MAHISPLRERHAQAEGSMLPYGPIDLHIELVETFGELDFEYSAVRKGCGLLDQPHRGTIEIVGDDRLGFLQSMVTQDMKDLSPMRSRASFWLNKKGRIVSDLRVIELGDRTLLDMDAHSVDATIESLGAYIIAEDVELRDASERMHRLALHGPTSMELIAAAGEHSAGTPVGDLSHGSVCVVTIGGHEVVVERWDSAGAPGLELSMATDSAPAVFGRLVELGQPHNGEGPGNLAGRVRLRPIGWLAYNTARIEAGTVLFNIDFSTESLPAETGLLSSRVSFNKGCYLGQEIVARMHNLGKPKQRLVSFKPGGERTAEGFARQPVGGAQVFAGSDPSGDPIGVVTSSTISPMLGGSPACFAVVKSAYSEPGTVLAVHAEGAVLTGEVREGMSFLER